MAVINRALTWNDRPIHLLKQALPADTGISSVNLKAAAGVIAGAVILDWTGFKNFLLSFKQVIVGTTPTEGVLDIEAIGYAEDGTTILVPATKIWTGLDLKEAAATHYTAISFNVDTGVMGISTTTTAAGTEGSCKALRACGKVKFQFNTTEASNAGTSHVGSLTVRAST